jgi:hypothetical protein
MCSCITPLRSDGICMYAPSLFTVACKHVGVDVLSNNCK